MRTRRAVTGRGAKALLVGVSAVACVLVGLVSWAGPAVAAGTPINGGGSSFAEPEIQQWIADQPNVPVSYAVSSSGTGRDGYAQGALQYGASDIVYYSEDGNYQQQAASQHPFKYVTVSAGGLAFMYNIVINGQRFTGLNLTQKEACQIFTGQLTMWSQLASTPGDSALASVNLPIHPVIRSDAAGESYVFSQYCIAVDPGDWTTFRNYVDGPGGSANASDGWQGDSDMASGQPIEYWPPYLSQSGPNPDIAIPENGAPAVVNAIENPANGFSIGYMAASYAVVAGYPMASVQNPAGNFVQPNANTVQIALSYATLNSLGTFDLNFTGSNPAAYFPSTYSYILAPTTTNATVDAGADATLAQFLCYAVGAGQQDAPRLRYAPLSQQVTQLSVAAIDSIPYPGGPPSKLVPNCGVGGPEPAVNAPGVVTPVQIPPGQGGTPGATTAPGVGTTTTAPGGAATTGPGGVTATTAAGGTANSAAIGSSVAHPTGTTPGGLAGGAPAGSGSPQPCATTTTSATSTTTSTVPKKGSTTTVEAKGATTARGPTTTAAPKNGGTTTTLPDKGATSSTSSTTSSSTTSTTVCRSGGTTAAGGAGISGAAGSNGAGYGGAPGEIAGSPTTVPLVAAPASSTATNSQSYWYLLVGAAVCAVGVGAVELRRRPAG